ncbi:MAG TPA: molybdopterin-binding protein [Bacteroidales bacterium]|nr:molybdopterin-binding protein [Bacteroidales bacterium]
MKGTVLSVNISLEKGTIKTPVEHIRITETGIASDAHAGEWHRQVSLLSIESIQRFGVQAGRAFQPGEFAENITTEGLNLMNLKPGDRLRIGTAVLEVTQLGKKCHGDGCAIFVAVGKCVMPKEGIFCRVIQPGQATAGDAVLYEPKPCMVHVLTLSDRAYRGEYEDRSGPEVIRLSEFFFQTRGWEASHTSEIIPDDEKTLGASLQRLIGEGVDIIIATGGTGVGPRDITPDVFRRFMDKEIPGIMEMIRLRHAATMPRAVLSRAVAGLSGRTLMYAIPGSPGAVRDYMAGIQETLEHLIYMVRGIDVH